MKKLMALFLAGIIVFSNISAFAKPKGKINSSSYILTSVSNGTVLYQKDVDAKINPREFSKMMCALIISEKANFNKVVTFDDVPAFYNDYGNIANVKKGTSFTIKEHLHNMLLLYSDASATVLAKNHSGTSQKFVDKMNKKAKELGMNSTLYVSPSGYDPENKSYTTVSDTAILAREIYKNKDLMDIFSTVLFKLPDHSGALKQYSSRNHLISKYTYDKYNYSVANGLMASPDGDNINLAATASKSNTDLIVIAAGCKNDSSLSIYRDAINLFEYGYNQFYFNTICAEGDALAEVTVPSSSVKSMILSTENSIKALLPYNYDASLITFKVDAPKSISPPVKKGEQVGSVTYYYDGNFLASANLITDKKASFNIFAFLHDNVFNNFNTMPVILVLLVLIVIIQVRHKEAQKKKKRLKKKQELLKKIK